MKKILYLKALKFVAMFLILGSLAFFLLSFASGFFALIAAYSSQLLLSVLGVQTQIVFQQNPHLISPAFDAELITLCWGLLEMAVIVGIIASSEDRAIFQRIYGILLGIFVVLFFNAMRIAVTLRLFNSSEPFASEIAHDVLFRISLVLVVLGYYAFWYLVLTALKSKAAPIGK